MKAEDQAFPASKPPEVMRHMDFCVHHNKVMPLSSILGNWNKTHRQKQH